MATILNILFVIFVLALFSFLTGEEPPLWTILAWPIALLVLVVLGAIWYITGLAH